MVGGGLEKAGVRFGPEFGHGHAERFLAPEVMEKRPLRDVGCAAEVIHRGRSKAIASDNVPRCLKEPDARAAAFGGMLGGSGH